jgi:amidase
VSSKPICDCTAAELAVLLAKGALSSVELTQACLDRVAAIDGRINAIVTPNPQVKAEAEASDARRRAGQLRGPLDGIPYLAKDNLETAGLRTTYGSQLMADNVPAEDAVSVERMRLAGAVLIGKGNTPEFAHDIRTDNLLFGPTRNPIDLSRTAGGSSGGPAAAVAAGMVPIALGTDLGGSIRLPAAMCGILGHRPTPGRVPVYPTDFGWDLLVSHVHGPLARCAQDLGLVMAALSGPDDRDPSSLPSPGIDYAAAATNASIAGSRIAYCPNLGGLIPIEPEVADLCRAGVAAFETLGAHVEEAGFDASDLMGIAAGTRGFGMVGRYAHRLATGRDRMTAHLIGQVEDGLRLSVEQVTQAERSRTAYWHRLRPVFERYDYLVTPTIGAPAFPLDGAVPTHVAGKPIARYYDVYRFTYAFSVVGLPVAAVPCGHTKEGLPVGLQIVARRTHDEQALQAAAAYTTAFPQHIVTPSCLAALQ